MIGELHVMPILDLRDRRSFGVDPSFMIETELAAPNRFVVRRPCPSGAVAGAAATVNGFILPLFNDDQRRTASVAFVWRLGLDVVRHVVDFDLKDAAHVDQPVWTMDGSYWSLAGDPRLSRQPDLRSRMAISCFSERELPPRHRRTLSARRTEGRFEIRENLTIYPLPRLLMEGEAMRRAADRGAAA